MRALFFDLDDTLLNSDKKISARNKNAIIQCKEQGFIIGYITARSTRKQHEFLEGLPCDCIATYTGAMIYSDGYLITQHTMDFDKTLAAIKEIQCAAPDVDLVAYFEPYTLFKNQIINLQTGEKLPTDIFNAPKHDFQALRLAFGHYHLEQLQQYFYIDVNFQKTAAGTVMIANRHASKENALKTLAAHYQLSLKDCIAFGDDKTDIEMLKLCGTAVAVGNALLEVKTIANVITTSNDEDGIAEYLEHQILHTPTQKVPASTLQ
jgi:Cof subfamily protein (haloacid dehalogenase superfamily)